MAIHKDIMLTTKRVVSKKLVDDIHKVLGDALSNMRVKWLDKRHRESFVDVIEDFMVDVRDNGYITQFKVIFDKRNNIFTKSTEYFFLDVYYKQPHCEHMTWMRYRIPNPDYTLIVEKS